MSNENSLQKAKRATKGRASLLNTRRPHISSPKIDRGQVEKVP